MEPNQNPELLHLLKIQVKHAEIDCTLEKGKGCNVDILLLVMLNKIVTNIMSLFTN